VRAGPVVKVLAFCLALAGCGAPQGVAADPPQPAGWKVALIAGDNHEPAFDNAVEAMADKLVSFGVPRADMTVLEASGQDSGAATEPNIRATLTHLDPGPREGCFVYVTSHGAKGRGLVMVRARAFLAPEEFDRMLYQGCGDRPTVVIASGCFSGIFAEVPGAAPNRVVLTAARDDRPSFGCNAQQQFTVFDRCALENIETGLTWTEAMDRIRACVTKNETELHVDAPSEPQLSVGADEQDLRVFPH
jgi:hypothetical protein